MRIAICFLVLAMMFLPPSGLAQHEEAAPPVVSIVRLLSNPDKYDGKRVAVLGFLTIGQENNYLYLGKNDYDNLLPNSIWVDVSDEMVKKRSELSMKYVRMVGIFHQGHPWRSSIYVGGIGEISDCSVVSDPDHPFSEKLKGLVRHEPTAQPPSHTE
jgi:hypothetical protein